MAATNEEALARGLQELPGWQRHGDGIWKTYEFDDFASATMFVGRNASSGWLATTTIRSAGPPRGARVTAWPASGNARWARPARRPGTYWPEHRRRATIRP